MKLDSVEHSLVLRDELVTIEEQHDLDALGIAKNAREEKARARDERLRRAWEDERMAKLYRKHILKEPETPELVQIERG